MENLNVEARTSSRMPAALKMESKKMMMNEDKSEDDLKSMTDSLDDY